jgi:hypothetical protein
VPLYSLFRSLTQARYSQVYILVALGLAQRRRGTA